MEAGGFGPNDGLRDVHGMLVAAGFGTRLAPLTDELPKPAVPVANRPLAAFALSHLARAGIARVVVNTHHLASQLRAALSPWASPGVELRFVHEPRILGTGGGIKHAFPETDVFVVVNGKYLHEPDLAALVHAHRERGALATLGVMPMPPGAGFAPVDVDRDGFVRAIREPELKPGLTRCMFTGVRALHPRVKALLPDEGCFVGDGLLRWLAAGEPVAAVIDDAPFADLGRSVGHYHQGNMDLLTGRRTWPGLAVDASTRSLVASGVHLPAGCELDRCAIGAGASVQARRLTRVVVWPGAQVSEDLMDVIVTTAGRVVPVGPSGG